jgi:hypothetical protein
VVGITRVLHLSNGEECSAIHHGPTLQLRLRLCGEWPEICSSCDGVAERSAVGG